MIDDALTQTRVLAEFHWDPRLADAEIAVVVRDNVASLSGSVVSNAVKQAAARAAERVAGVSAVANAIVVVPRGQHERTDTELAHAVIYALRSYALIQTRDIRSRIEKGWVVLEGTVEHAYQRDEAEMIVAGLIGVRGVTNLLQCERPVDANSVAADIRESLLRHAIAESSIVTVVVEEGAIILRGDVQSFAERELAEHAARNSGVSEIRNEIHVKEISASWRSGA